MQIKIIASHSFKFSLDGRLPKLEGGQISNSRPQEAKAWPALLMEVIPSNTFKVRQTLTNTSLNQSKEMSLTYTVLLLMHVRIKLNTHSFVQSNFSIIC